MYRKSRLALLSLAVALVVAAMFTHPAQAGTSASTADLPLSGSFFNSVTGEYVDITGDLHIVTSVTFFSTALTTTLYATIPDNVTAIGRTSGRPYRVDGVNQIQITASPTSSYPPTPVRKALSFTVWPPGPIRWTPRPSTDDLIMSLSLRFTTDGVLLEGSSSVSVIGDSIDSFSGD